MSRVKEIRERGDLPAEHGPIFDEIVAAYDGRVGGPFWVLLHSPEVARRISHTGDYVRHDSPLPADVRELAVIATARELDCLYEWKAHEGGARRAGVREEAIAAVRDHEAPEGLTDDERLVVTYVQELLRNHRVPEETFQAALQRFGLQQLVDLSATIGHYCMLACTLNAFDVRPDTTPLLPV